jgi:hypothetical protein
MARKASKTAATRMAPRALGAVIRSYAVGSGRCRRQIPCASIGTDGLAQCAPGVGRAAELHGETAEHRLALEVPPGLRDLVLEHRGQREVLHERHDVGERFVEGERVAVRR